MTKHMHPYADLDHFIIADEVKRTDDPLVWIFKEDKSLFPGFPHLRKGDEITFIPKKEVKRRSKV